MGRRVLWRIDCPARHHRRGYAPGFVAGLVVEDGQRIVEAAPILARWMGIPWPVVRQLLRERGFHGDPIPIPDDPEGA